MEKNYPPYKITEKMLNYVSDIMKKIGEQKDIQEVKNAYQAYEQIEKVNPYSVEDLKKIHGILTFLIEKDAGKFRNHGEAVYDGNGEKDPNKKYRIAE